MAGQPSELTVRYSDLARRHLREIWSWNAEEYDADHADRYLRFLLHGADSLSKTYSKGKAIEARPDYRIVTLRRKRRGHGHVLVYLVEDDSVIVLGIYHTAQDWQGKVERGEL